jgi:cytochrome c-type protein NapC
MRWWASLRQAYPNRSGLTLAIAALVVMGVIGGGITVAAAVTVHMTSTEEFCSSCHTNDAAAEFKDTIHDKNRTGVRAECADCHLPREFVPMMVRKVEAAREVWGNWTGYIDTKEK